MSTNQSTALAELRNDLPQLKAVLSLNAMPGVDVHTLALQELEFLSEHAISKPAILECLPNTVLLAVKRVLKQNLSLDPNAGLVYVKTRNLKQGDTWVKVLEIEPTANGLISINQQCGVLLDIDRPRVEMDESGKVAKVVFRFLKPSVDEKGEKCTRWVEKEYDETDFMRWRIASHKENGRNKQDANIETLNYANANYTSWKGGVDPEFARAKAIRHGLKKEGTNPHAAKFKSITIPVPKKVVNETESMVDEPAEQYTEAEIVDTTINKPSKPVNEKIDLDL